MPLCLIWRALVAGVGATKSGTTTGPATPSGAKWMCPATNVSLALLRIWVLNSIVPSARTLISVWPLASDVEPVVADSDLAVSFECRTQLTPRPFFAVAPPTLRAATTDAAKTTSNRRRITASFPWTDPVSLLDIDPTAARSLRCGGSTAENPSILLRPITVGKRDSLEWLIVEGETDTARILDLAPGLVAVLCLPAGARTFKPEWAALIPRGATVYLAHDNDEEGDKGAEKAARILGGETLRLAHRLKGATGAIGAATTNSSPPS